MEKKQTDKAEVTIQLLSYMKDYGVMQQWILQKLGINRNTYVRRITKNNWKASEILALQQLNILK